MSRKFIRAYICDRCGALGKSEFHIFGHDFVKTAPTGWGKLGSADLCPTCTKDIMVSVEEESVDDSK